MRVAIVGAGLAGCEAAWILAEHYGVEVTLFEMKRERPTPAQSSRELFAELVCSNSLKSESRLNPAGLLKTELARLGSLLMPMALEAKVPAGETLAVDRERFSASVTGRVRSHPRIAVVEREVKSTVELQEFDATIVATGPLTADALAENLRERTGSTGSYFYDAIAPILVGESIDLEKVFWQNRATRAQGFARRMGEEDVEEGEGDYLNIPLNKEEYNAFVERVRTGERVPFHEFEEPRFFSGCQPIEVLADSGPMTLAFGPMKPRGLTDPRTGRMPFAAIQLRRETLGDDAFNMVGFQTRLTWPAQRAIFRTLPGLENAEFFRMGSMHRNTYFVGPAVLNSDLSLRADPKVFLAGQLMGVEGYVESAAMGVLVGHVLGARSRGTVFELPPVATALGALVRYVLHSDVKHFSPMNIHWGLFDALSDGEVREFAPDQVGRRKIDKSMKRHVLALRAEKAFGAWWQGS